jgi:nitrous oxidase accessory protein NosD
MGTTGSGAGIYLSASSPLIANNTIAGNTSGNAAGILCQGASKPRVVNNCIAYNSSGVFAGTGTAPTLLNNCVYGNAQYNYLGLSAGPGDRSQDPVFVDRSKGNYRLRGDSPCVDAGSNTDAPPRDRDGRRVPFDGNSDGVSMADIGADELRRIFVSKLSPGPFNGDSWLTAYRAVQQGIDAAVLGDEIWVAAGAYSERVVLKNGVALFGGFRGTETSREQRNWARSPVIIDGGSNGSTVTVPNGCGSETRLDGFTVCKGNALQGGGLAIYGSNPVITNNKVLDNNALYGGGIYLYSSPAAAISGNMIIDNTASHGAGLFCSASSGLKITNNTICDNSASVDGGGILASSSPSSIYNNIVAFNSSGIHSYGAQTVRYNCVYGNAAFNYLGAVPGSDDFSADPLFEDRLFGNYQLTVSSPCINAGTPAAPGLPGLDIEAEGRVFGLSVDVGADEFWLSTMTVSDAKRARDGLSVEIGRALVTAVFGSSFYIESENRANGIRVDAGQQGANPGTVVHVHGTVMTDANGERYVVATEIVPIGSGDPEPVSLPLRSLGGGSWFYDPIVGVGQEGIRGGAGLNNLCLLVRTIGRVTSVEPGYLYMDDGSGMRDGTAASGTQNIGVRVQCDTAGCAVGDYLAVTGISSAFADGGYIHRLLRATNVVAIDP